MPGGANISWIKYSVIPSPILDSVTTADAAYSTRLLRTAYSGSALRVRRSSDNTEQDIGFLNGELDTASMLSFVGANNGFVATWYDQSGNARNMTQTTQAAQPQIVNAGAVITQSGKPCLQMSTAQYMDIGVVLDYKNTAYSFWVVYSKLNASVNDGILISDSFDYLYLQYASTFYAGNNSITGYTLTNNTPIYACAIRDSAPTISYYKNGTVVNTLSDTNTNEAVRYIGLDSFRNSQMTFSEIIIYPSDKTASRTTVDTNISSYYSL